MTKIMMSDLEMQKIFDSLDVDGGGSVGIDELTDFIWGTSYAADRDAESEAPALEPEPGQAEASVQTEPEKEPEPKLELEPVEASVQTELEKEPELEPVLEQAEASVQTEPEKEPEPKLELEPIEASVQTELEKEPEPKLEQANASVQTDLELEPEQAEASVQTDLEPEQLDDFLVVELATAIHKLDTTQHDLADLRVRVRGVAQSMTAWRDFTKSEKAARSRQAQVVRRIQQLNVSGAFFSWQTTAQRAARVRVILEHALDQKQSMTLADAFFEMRAHCHKLVRVRRMVYRLGHRSVSTMFREWVHSTAGHVQGERLNSELQHVHGVLIQCAYASAAQRIRLRSVAKSVTAWREMTRRKKALRGKHMVVLKRIQHVYLARALISWQSTARRAKRVRVIATEAVSRRRSLSLVGAFGALRSHRHKMKRARRMLVRLGKSLVSTMFREWVHSTAELIRSRDGASLNEEVKHAGDVLMRCTDASAAQRIIRRTMGVVSVSVSSYTSSVAKAPVDRTIADSSSMSAGRGHRRVGGGSRRAGSSGSSGSGVVAKQMDTSDRGRLTSRPGRLEPARTHSDDTGGRKKLGATLGRAAGSSPDPERDGEGDPEREPQPPPSLEPQGTRSNEGAAAKKRIFAANETVSDSSVERSGQPASSATPALSVAARSRQAQVVRRIQQLNVSGAFFSWQTTAQRAARVRVILDHALDRKQSMTLADAFFEMRAHCHKLVRVRRMVYRLGHRSVSMMFREWVHSTAGHVQGERLNSELQHVHGVLMQCAYASAAQRIRLRSVAKSVTAWREMTRRKKALRGKHMGVLKRIQHVHLTRALVSWQSRARRAKRVRVIATEAVSRRRSLSVVGAFATLRSHRHKMIRARRMLVRLGKSLVSMMFREWVHSTAELIRSRDGASLHEEVKHAGEVLMRCADASAAQRIIRRTMGTWRLKAARARQAHMTSELDSADSDAAALRESLENARKEAEEAARSNTALDQTNRDLVA
eukprot:COSAG06_NODE_4472_length_4218_cov_6.503520_2_plen_992_part_01